MASDFQIPPSTRAAGNTGHIGDHNNMALALTASPQTVFSVLNTAYAGGADPTGVSDSTAAIQAAITAAGTSPVYLPGGTYLTSSALALVPGQRICGAGYSAATITNSSSHLFAMGPGSLLDGNEIDHLDLTSATGGGDIFNGCNVARLSVHHCNLIQHNAGQSIWDAPATVEMNECSFYENRETVYGSPRSAPAWNLLCNQVNINNNTWREHRCFNHDPDITQYWYYLAFNNASTGAIRNNRFSGITIEAPAGGFIRLESVTGCVIDQCFAWDIAANVVGNHLFSIGKNATATNGSLNNTIRDCGRNGGSNMGGFADVHLDSSTAQTTIQNQHLVAGGSALVIDVGSSATCQVIGCAVSPTNPSSDTLIMGGGHFSAGNPLVNVTVP